MDYNSRTQIFEKNDVEGKNFFRMLTRDSKKLIKKNHKSPALFEIGGKYRKRFNATLIVPRMSDEDGSCLKIERDISYLNKIRYLDCRVELCSRTEIPEGEEEEEIVLMVNLLMTQSSLRMTREELNL